MITIQDNFTNSISLLKKEKKRRLETSFNTDELLENHLWVFLYNIGFTKLNIERQCQVSYGRDSKNLVTKNVDIIAESKDAKLFIECTTQQDSTSKIKNWISDVEGIRKYENAKAKNIIFIYFTTQELLKGDKTKLKEKGIKLLNEKILEYFSELVKLYKNLTYYQLLAYLLKGQFINSFDKKDFEIPAIRCKYTSKEYCYLFGIQPFKLIPLTTVLHRKMDIEDEISENYQRLVKKRKINEIKKYISKERGVFPTNIIISFDVKGKNYFKPLGKKINDIQFGLLTLPSKYQSITIIDGQHRLFAYDGLSEAENDLIFVIAFHKMDAEKQVQTFVDINEKQTKVSASLMWDLYPSILDSSDIKTRISKIVKKLNTKDENSALFGVISYDSAPYSNKGSKITLESLCTAIKQTGAVEKISHALDYLQIDNKQDKTISKILNEYFNVIQELNAEHWNRNEKTKNLLRSNQGIGALTRLFVEVFDYLLKKDKIELLRTNGIDELHREFKNLLTPVNNLILTLKTIEEIKTFKRIGEGGKYQIFLDFLREINRKFADFGIQILEKLENKELEEIIAELIENAEHNTLEAKESFFADTKRLKATKQLHQNSDDTIRGIIKTVVAFSNYKGGKIVIGIEDRTWNSIGIDETDLKLKIDWDTLKQSISQKITAETEGLSLAPEIKKIIHNSKVLAIIDIKPLDKKRFEEQDLVILKHDNNCYKRENGDSLIIKSNEIKKYCSYVLKELEEDLKNQEE